MRLIQCTNTDGYHLRGPFASDESIPPYAILSHTWGADLHEVTFNDLTNGTGKDKPSYEKIRFCGEQAARNGLQYVWIDTCCINKANKAELSQAINSMFLWYRNAARCYVHLSDVSTAKQTPNSNTSCDEWEFAFRNSRWFTRGWTLQELLAPRSVEFFSQQGERLGDKYSLRQKIHEITAIPEPALQGSPLSQFTVNDRLSWIEHRQTKLEEDKAYSLLGIFGVYIPPIYGEGVGRAFRRLQDEISSLEKCIQDLHITDPRRDKARIEETKGGLLEDSYKWILNNNDFQRWRAALQSRLLWIKGDPGKGKTMLLCGIINELNKSMADRALLSYFFCQATDSRINSATSVLRGLLFLLVSQQPSLVSHIQKKHNQTGKALFEDSNAWVAMSEIFTDVLRDPKLNKTYFFIDALDECLNDLDKLLAFIVQKSSQPSHARVKWILTSRNYSNIEQKLQLNSSGTRISLELKENAAQIAHAVDAYIDHRILELEQIQHDESLQFLIREKIQQKANGTFLWVSLIIKELKGVMAWEVLEVLEEVPTELKDVYWRMMEHIKQLKRQNPELCKRILSTVITTYRPMHLQELCVLADLPSQGPKIQETTRIFVKMCGSFLTIRDDHVYVVHQSATDFLLENANANLFSPGAPEIHSRIFSRSIQTMSKTLRRNMYKIESLGHPIEQVQQPSEDPLVASRYSCVYWIDHLCDWNTVSDPHRENAIRDGGAIDTFLRYFLRTKYLYWMEALSLCKSMSKGVVSMTKLESLASKQVASPSVNEIVRDALRHIMYWKWAVESSPLQAYASALLFSPTGSQIRRLFKHEEPKNIAIRLGVDIDWSTCLLTLEGHDGSINSVTFSHDSTRLASASDDGTVMVWDASSSERLSTLGDHGGPAKSVSFSHDSTQLVSVSNDGVFKIWDVDSGKCKLMHGSYGRRIIFVGFSRDSTRLVSVSDDGTVMIWDAGSGECLSTLEDHSDLVPIEVFPREHTVHVPQDPKVAFSRDSTWLALALYDGTVKVWNTSRGECRLTFKRPSHRINPIAFSHNSTRLALAEDSGKIMIRDARSGECQLMVKCNNGVVTSLSFSHDSTRLAVGSDCNGLVPSSILSR